MTARNRVLAKIEPSADQQLNEVRKYQDALANAEERESMERDVRRQLAEALRQIEFLPYSAMGDTEADLRRTKEIAHVALAASDALDKEEA